jgi:hypothetical protein
MAPKICKTSSTSEALESRCGTHKRQIRTGADMPEGKLTVREVLLAALTNEGQSRLHEPRVLWRLK